MRFSQFIQIGDHTIVHSDEIDWVDIRRLEDLVIVVHYAGGEQAIVSGIQAIDVIMAIRPSALEGRRLRWKRHVWAFHNLVGHPLMQLLVFLKQYKLAIKVHDLTVPQPEGKHPNAGTTRKTFS